MKTKYIRILEAIFNKTQLRNDIFLDLENWALNNPKWYLLGAVLLA